MYNLKSWFWLLLDVVLVAIVANLVFFVMPALHKLGNSFAPARTMAISAEGKAEVAPDLAEISFSVIARGANPEDLTADNNDKMSAAAEFVKSQGVNVKDIKTIAYDLSPDYRYDPTTQRNFITGYTLTQTVDVKIRDFSKIAPIIGGLTPLGVNQIGGVSFTVDDQEKALKEARADAFAKAEAKAQEMAAASGVRLGRVINVAEFQNGVPQPYTLSARADVGAAMALPTIEPGTHEARDQVTITYELE